MESFTIKAMIPASPEQIYSAWLSSEGHSMMTGSKADVQEGIGGAFTAWDGYIWGKTLETENNRRIVQAWRTSEFPEGSPDSRVEILLEETGADTKITLIHTGIPDGQSEGYQEGWEDFYFSPMRAYFSR